MASFGAKYIKFAPISEELETALPKYGEGFQIGALVRADLTVNLASGEIYGDDVLDERIEEFVSGTLSVEVTDLEDEKENVIFGSSLKEDKELVDSTKDTIPYGGLGYLKTLIRGGKKLYRAYFYPKVKAVMGNDNAATKASSITLASSPLSFTIFEPKTGDWRYRKTFNSEAEAKAYIDEKLAVANAQAQTATEGSSATEETAITEEPSAE